MSAPKTYKYQMAFACLDCCKSFKREVPNGLSAPKNLPCANCGGTAHNFGRHFKPPPSKDKKQWDKIRFLFAHGFRFQKIRIKPNSLESVPYPQTLKEAEVFVEAFKDHVRFDI